MTENKWTSLKVCAFVGGFLILLVGVGMAPRPASVASQRLSQDEYGPAFYVLPPGIKPINSVRPSKFRHARRSYAWRRHGGKLQLVQFSTQIQHIVVILMENRTPDNLFAGYYSTQYPPDPTGTTFGQALDLANPAGTPTLVPNHLSAAFDPLHGYQSAFQPEAAGLPGPTPLCAGGTCTTSPPGTTLSINSYVPTSDVTNYVNLIEQWAYGSHVMQSNEGPSFESHQYAIAGQSGAIHESHPLTTPTPYGMVENPAKNGTEDDASDPDPDAINGGGSCATVDTMGNNTRHVQQIDMSQPYPEPHSHTTAPCNEYKTVLDEMQTWGGTPYYLDWQYVAENPTIIWSGPMAVTHLWQYYSETPGPVPTWQQPFAADPDALQFVADRATPSPGATYAPTHRSLAALTYLTPCKYESDHPEFQNFNDGPDWLDYVINSIGESPDWANTAIIVTWDDWGGWYDHFQPTPAPSPAPTYSPVFPFHPSPNAYHQTRDPYEWGFRVPFIVISPYVVSRGYVSTKTRSQGAILNFIESSFSLDTLGTDDKANGSDDLSDFFDMVLPLKTFSPLPTSYSPPPVGTCNAAP